jgi:hypothetical protein
MLIFLLTIEVPWNRPQIVLTNILALPSSTVEQWPLRPSRERYHSTPKSLQLFSNIHGVILYKYASLYQNCRDKVEHPKILFSFKWIWCSGLDCEVPLVLFKISLTFIYTIHSNFVKLLSVEMCNTISCVYNRLSYTWQLLFRLENEWNCKISINAHI